LFGAFGGGCSTEYATVNVGGNVGMIVVMASGMDFVNVEHQLHIKLQLLQLEDL
jgi:hypothetical protein